MSQGLAGVRKTAPRAKSVREAEKVFLIDLVEDGDRNGNFTVKRRTIRKRMRAKLREIKQQLSQRMHDPVAQTGEWLKSVVKGYFNYHAVPGNIGSLRVYRVRVIRLWRRTLLRRSQKHRLIWTRMHRLAERWVPKPRPLHPYPEHRFAASHPR